MHVVFYNFPLTINVWEIEPCHLVSSKYIFPLGDQDSEVTSIGFDQFCLCHNSVSHVKSRNGQYICLSQSAWIESRWIHQTSNIKDWNYFNDHGEGKRKEEAIKGFDLVEVFGGSEWQKKFTTNNKLKSSGMIIREQRKGGWRELQKVSRRIDSSIWRRWDNKGSSEHHKNCEHMMWTKASMIP